MGDARGRGAGREEQKRGNEGRRRARRLAAREDRAKGGVDEDARTQKVWAFDYETRNSKSCKSPSADSDGVDSLWSYLHSGNPRSSSLTIRSKIMRPN